MNYDSFYEYVTFLTTDSSELTTTILTTGIGSKLMFNVVTFITATVTNEIVQLTELITTPTPTT